jgi:hypothetical protein
MSADLKALIVRNELNLPREAVDRLLTQNGRKALYALSPDKESGPFLLFCCGDDFDTIATKMNLPRDVIVATAIQYRWPDKARMLNRTDSGIVPGDLQKELVNTILVATIVAMQRDLGEVIAGRKEAKDCPLIPSSPQALQKLMEMVTSLNNPTPADPMKPQTVIHATNVQVNQQQGLPEAPKALPETPEKATELKLAMLKDIEGDAG